MRIAILGSGAMGSVFGARLALGGTEVTLLDINDAHLNAIQENGLQVDLDGVVQNVALPAQRPEAFIGPVDVIILFTKIFDTDTALASVAKHLPGTFVLSLQNGIGNAERIKTHVRTEKIIMGKTMTPAEFLGPGHVASHGPASTAFYSLNGAHSHILDDLVQVIANAGIAAKATPDIQIGIWEKAAFNCAMNAACALTGATVGAFGQSEPGRALAARVAAEAIAVARAQSIEADLSRVQALMTHA